MGFCGHGGEELCIYNKRIHSCVNQNQIYMHAMMQSERGKNIHLSSADVEDRLY
jgi:hypothetical protein